MSIRLRLTLLYSGIVALTLLVFGTALYATQAQSTLDSFRTALARQADGFEHGPGRFDDNGPVTLPPVGSTLPGRWTQLRAVDGTVLARTYDLTTALPLSAQGLAAAQHGQSWFENASFDSDTLLIYTHPAFANGDVAALIQVAAPITLADQSLSALRLILVIGSGIVVLIAFAIGWILSGLALSPIHRITQTAQAIGAEHDFSRRVEHVGPSDEVGQLAVTFNTMLSELETAYDQLQESLDSQRRFVADASHELRTPLTTVRGNIALLGHNPPPDTKERADILADTKEEVERLIRLVQQLLVLARADAGQKIELEPVALKPILEDVCRQMRLRAPQRVIVCDDLTDVTVMGNRDALKQVALILLDNAVVHTGNGATIQLTNEVEDSAAAMRVRDTGAGIAPSALPHIFERFYRGDIARSGSNSGLGLAIAQELMVAQNGTITVESELGKGTTFVVRLPRA